MFEHINEVVQEASMATCDAILNYIDKYESCKEFTTSEEFDECFQESMMYFMEAASKDKDEITKWMAKKGYWYDGDNPKKKKECNRMYQFLKQHDFRPSDETYKTNINDGNGGKRRIKLNIDPNTLSDDDKELLKNSKKYGVLSFEKDNYERAVRKAKHDSGIKAGNNASHVGYRNKSSGEITDEEIQIGSKLLKGKQYNSEQTLKHEEGHAESLDRKTAKRKNAELSEEHPANVAIKEHINSGKYANGHDASSEELMADLYSAANSQIRTKHWGKNKTTRKVTRGELTRYFNKLISDMDDCTKDDLDSIFVNLDSETANFEERMKKSLKNVEDSVKSAYEPGSYNRFKNDEYEKAWEKIASSLLIYVGFDLKHTIFSYGMGQYVSDTIETNTEKKYTIKSNQKQLNRRKEKLKQYNSMLERVKDAFESHGIKNSNDIKKFIKTDDLDRELVESIFNWAQVAKDVIRETVANIDHFEKIIKETEEEIKSLTDKDKYPNSNNPHIKRIIKFVEEGSKKMISNNFKFPEELPSKIIGEAKSLFNEVKEKSKSERKEDLAKAHKENEESTGLRIKFAQTAIKEYFEDFINDFIYND